MLTGLHVKNMALIREEEISFGPGLNILTGETGAGKSIIIGSVNVALGTGNFRDYVPEDSEYSLVELIFETKDPDVLGLLAGEGIPEEDGQIILSRQYRNGRSLSRVNGESVTVSFVRNLAAALIDIHGQHAHQSLMYPSFHLKLLDKYAARNDLLESCAAAYRSLREVGKELEGALMDEKERAKQIDLVSYEIREIDDAQLTEGEDISLEEAYARMAHGQKIMDVLGQVSALAGPDSDAGDAISRADGNLSGILDLDPNLTDLGAQLTQIDELLSDFGRDLAGYLDDFSYDEQTFYEMGKRLDVINHLKTKYGRSIREIERYRDSQQEILDRLQDYEAYLQKLRDRKEKAEKDFSMAAGKLREVRKKAARELEAKIGTALSDLNFQDVRFEIRFEELEEPGVNGLDKVYFAISTNPGQPVRPLQETASGGELSRVMLAIKAVMADQDAVGTLIFDEIDTGISGRTAQKVSEKMALIAKDHQVICITHLAQIAAMADTHFEITKANEAGQTRTHIRKLDGEESIRELARILGGAKITGSVMESAGEMRQLALEKKKEIAAGRF